MHEQKTAARQQPLSTLEHPTQPSPEIFYGAVDWDTSALQELRSFFTTHQDVLLFTAFVQEILCEDILLAEIVQRKPLHAGLLRYHFEQVGFVEASLEAPHNRVVLLRIHGELFAVRQVSQGNRAGVAPLVELAGIDSDTVLQVLCCQDFLAVWSQATGNPPTQYDVVSSIQPYLQSLLRGEKISVHQRHLIVESILGQGLEGTVFRVRDVHTQERLALKCTYKNLQNLYDTWQAGMEQIRCQAPEALEHLCPFYAWQSSAGKNGTLLMQYRPLAPLPSVLTADRLQQGLRLLADVIGIVRTLHQQELCHGDLGVSNTFVLRRADGSQRAVLIDPHPDASEDVAAHGRKDLFGIAHMLYWLVTGQQWPRGAYAYLLQVMAGEHNPREVAKIFDQPPLWPSDPDCRTLHAAALRVLREPHTYEKMVEKIMQITHRCHEAQRATPARIAGNAVVTGRDVERKIDQALRPIGSGIFLPLFSLPSYFGEKPPEGREYGMGDTGPAAWEFVRLLHAMGQKFWALLPNGPTDHFNCPYRTDSSFAININSISPERLLTDGWITAAELADHLPPSEDPGRVPLGNEAVFGYKRQLLDCAFQRRFDKEQATWQKSFATFLAAESYWIDDYALYKAIEREYPCRWNEWPAALRDGNLLALGQFAEQHAEQVEREKFSQFLAQHYFLQLREFAASQGVQLIGDMPAYSMHGSADVWAHREVFELAEDGSRTIVAGAPPDMFDPQGQGWNHPMYRWDETATVDFLKEKYARMKRLFAGGFVRDDHIIGKITPWGYPFSSPPAAGQRVTGKYLGNALFDAIIEEIPDLPRFLLGEDLGTVTAETERVMQHYGFRGMKVLQFMSFQQGPAAVATSAHTPGNYADENVLFLGTHDAPLIRAWWREGLDDFGRQQVSDYLRQTLGVAADVTDANVAALCTELAMAQTPQMMLHMLPDLLADQDGSVGLVDARMNNPMPSGNSRENWSWRLPPTALTEPTKTRLRDITAATQRTPETAIRRLEPLGHLSEEVLLAAACLRGQGQPALADQLEGLARQGQIRYAPLGAEILSAVYHHLDGTVYLLLSTEHEGGPGARHLPGCGERGLAPRLTERAVSLIRGLETYVRRQDPAWQSPLETITDDALRASAKETLDQLEQALRGLVAVSPDALREEMIAVLGGLLNPGSVTDPQVQTRLQALGAATSGLFARRFLSRWTQLWQTYERRGMARGNIIAGILQGELHGARVRLRGLRWPLLQAYAAELSAATRERDCGEATVLAWANTLGADALTQMLFGSPTLRLVHDWDPYGEAAGLSGLLGLLRKLRRQEKEFDYARCRDYALEVIRSVSQASPESEPLLALLASLHDERAFEAWLEILEHHGVARLARQKPPREQATPAFPAEIDTQLHSYYSDCGGQSIARLVYQAYRRGLKTIAITDHQCFDGVAQAREIGQLLGVEIIPAIELYTGIRRGDRVDQRRDVLVYFPDVPTFEAWWQQGLDEETWQLLNDGWNRKLDGSQWGDVPIRRVTDWARARGGVAVCAHPGLWSSEKFHQDDWSYASFERFFLETGLAGIEVSHSRLSFAENTRHLVTLVQQFNQRHPQHPLVFTLGTDSHIPDSIGQANLTAEALAFTAGLLAPGGSPAASLRTAIVADIQQTAARLVQQKPLYRLRDEVLQENYPGLTAHNRPLPVHRTDANQTSTTILAGVKMYHHQPILIVTNRGRREQLDGKDWGRLEIAKVWDIHDAEAACYSLRDLITGEEFHRTGAELVREGLHIGLTPHATQFLTIVPTAPA